MDKLYHRLLLKKYIHKEATPEEAKIVLKWLQDPKNEEVVAEIMHEVWGMDMLESVDEIEYDESWDKLQRKLTGNQLTINMKKVTAQIRLYHALRVAAVIGLFIISGYLTFYLVSSDITTNLGAGTNQFVRSTQKGEKLTFTLSDGTKVFLNSNTKLSILPDYGKHNRTVSLEGEAYFEVSKNEDLPFQVKTGPLRTTALGTSFNVQYVKNKENIKVSLTTGKIAVGLHDDNTDDDQTEILVPGEEAHYSGKQKVFEKTNFDTRSVTAWKDGILILRDENIHEIIEKLENWYAVEISLYGEMPIEGWTFTGEFRNEPLANVLKGLSFSKGITYTINKKKITIKL